MHVMRVQDDLRVPLSLLGLQLEIGVTRPIPLVVHVPLQLPSASVTPPAGVVLLIEFVGRVHHLPKPELARNERPG